MGLDIVEFVMSVEERFGIEIPDEDAQRLTTPRQLVDYIMTKVKAGQESGCLSQREFYRLRRAFIARHWTTRRDLKPDTPLEVVVPKLNRRVLWRKLGDEIRVPRWPSLDRPKTVEAGLIVATLVAFSLPLILLPDRTLRGEQGPIILSILFTIGTTWLGLVVTRPLKQHFSPICASVGDLVRSIIATEPRPEKVEQGWTREEVRETVRALIVDQFGITDFTDESHFVKDMHIDQ